MRITILPLLLYMNYVSAVQWDKQFHQRDESTSSSLSVTTSGGTTASSVVTSAHSHTTSTGPSNVDTNVTNPESTSSRSSEYTAANLPTSTAVAAIYNSTLTPNELPIKPEITPGFGVAGVILLASGALYTLVGIKNKWLHVYLSTAYLVGIATTVLILYVMNPPINNAIQGAYVVAAVMSGLIVGAGALIFMEMTEGLGCLLGGFCFSMWLLVMKPGGIITSTTGKSILIAVISIVAFSLSFSHYTRLYGLIVCISFAGATAMVIGIDCFSKAGLKEFWVYLWNLNENIFPVGAITYPLTRGIRIEIGAIFVIFLAGIVSQSKVHKLVKDRRAQHLADRQAGQRALEEEELNVGKRIEIQANLERKRWETAYGDRDGSTSNADSYRDSGVGDMESSKKWPASTVTSVRRSHDQEIELSEMPSPVCGGVVTQNQHHQVDAVADLERSISEDRNLFVSNRLSRASNKAHQNIDTVEEETWVDEANPLNEGPSQQVSEQIPDSTKTAIPDVVPVLLRVSNVEVEDDRSSIATFADEELPLTRHSRGLKRVSSGGPALLKRLSRGPIKESNKFSGHGVSTEELIVPDVIEDDRGSSVAATTDGLSDDEDAELRSVQSHFIDQDPSTMSAAAGIETEGQQTPLVPTEESIEEPVLDSLSQPAASSVDPVVGDSQDDGSRVHLGRQPNATSCRTVSESTGTTDILDAHKRNLNSTQLDPQHSSLLSSDSMISPMKEVDELENRDVDGAEDSKTGLPAPPSSSNAKHTGITKDRLPPQLSRVVMSYRTSEWAKHLSNAESPQLEELKIEDAIDDNQESAAPVDIEALQQTATNTPFPRSFSQPSTRPQNQHRRSSSTQSNVMTFASIPEDTTFDAKPPRNVPQQSSQGQIPHRSYRSSSSPIVPNNTRTATENSTQPHHSNVPQFNSTNTLIGKRDTMIRNKSYILPFQSYATPQEPIQYSPSLSQASSDTGSIRGSLRNYRANNPTAIIPEDDNMPLSHRRELIRQSSLLQPQQQPSGSNKPTNFDSHQPRRESSAPHPLAREQQLASWRASVAADLQMQKRKETKGLERQRSALWQERQAEEQKRAIEQRRRGERESAFDERMRRSGANGGLADLHRRMLGRMQEEARRNV